MSCPKSLFLKMRSRKLLVSHSVIFVNNRLICSCSGLTYSRVIRRSVCPSTYCSDLRSGFSPRAASVAMVWRRRCGMIRSPNLSDSFRNAPDTCSGVASIPAYRGLNSWILNTCCPAREPSLRERFLKFSRSSTHASGIGMIHSRRVLLPSTVSKIVFCSKSKFSQRNVVNCRSRIPEKKNIFTTATQNHPGFNGDSSDSINLLPFVQVIF